MTKNTFIQIKNFLSNKYITVAILTISIIGRIIQLIYFFNIGGDLSYQIIATKNLIEGRGISLDTVNPADLSNTIYTPLINWPPGFSVILSPFYILAGKNYLIASFALGVIAAIVLIFSTRGILKLLQLPVYLINLYTLVAGFFIYFFYFQMSTDAIMISFFSVALYYTLSLFIISGGWKMKTTIITVCLFTCASLKYLFVPATFIIPVFLIVKGYADKNTQWKKSGIYSFFFLLILVGLLLGYQFYISSSVGYISSAGRGFFPSHLLSAYPFVPGSVIRTESIGLLIKNSFIEKAFSKVFLTLHIVFLLGALFYIVRRVLKHGFKNLSPAVSFFYIAFLISLCITVVLAVLSLTVTKEWLSVRLWTYIEEQRYYGISNIFVHLGIFIAWWHFNPSKKKILNYTFGFLFILLFLEVFRGIIFDTNRVNNFRKEDYSWLGEYKLQQYADSIIKIERIKNPENAFIVTGSLSFITTRICIYSHVPIYESLAGIDNPSSLQTKKPVTMLVILPDKVLPGFQSFLSSKDKKQVGYFYKYNFYIVYVNPS